MINIIFLNIIMHIKKHKKTQPQKDILALGFEEDSRDIIVI